MKVALIPILEKEAEDCRLSALENSGATSEAFYVLSLSYDSLVKKLRAAANIPERKTDASKN